MPIAPLRLPAALLFGALALAACGGDRAGGADAAANVPEAERYGGTAVIGTFGDLQPLNSLTASDYNTNTIMREMLFMPLVKYNERIEPIPWLAERWDTVRVSPDSIDLTFYLRRDVRWHDGTPTTAKDVKFTFERAVDPKTAFPNASGFGLYRPTAELVDDYTVRLRLRPHAEFMDMWYQTAIMPEHLLASTPPEELIRSQFGYNPVGNGPFRFVRRVPGQEWVFEANPDFPEALGGRPHLDRVVQRYIPEMTTLLTDLLTGRIDVFFGPNPAMASQIEGSPNTRLIAAPNRQWVYVAWNTKRPFFQDARVRRALTMAINREQIVDALLYGYADVGRSTVTAGHWSYDPENPDYILPHDTAAARQLLAEAGWQDRDGNGVLEDAQGREFRFTLITNAGNDVRRDMLEIIQADLRPLGIVVQPKLVEWTSMIEQLQGSLNRQGQRVREFDAVVSSWVDYVRKDDSDILHSRNLNNPYQYVGYSNPRADALIDTLGIMTDREAAAPLWHEYQQLMVQESPYTPIYVPKRLTGVSRRLQDVVMDARGELATVTEWWIAPGQRRGASAAATPGAADSGAAN